MVLVDTTVWVDFFAGRDASQVLVLEGLLQDGKDICICGVILTEVLKGIRNNAEHVETLSRFEAFLFSPMNRSTFVKAADAYRTLRRKGMPIRKPIDCIIAAVAIEHNVPLLHKDRDFDPIETNCGLKMLRVA